MITRLFAMFCLVIISAGTSMGQTRAERSAFNNLEKYRWDKAEANMNKALRKDSASTTVHYLKALYFFSEQNPAYQIDSAYTFCQRAMGLYQPLEPREREKMDRIPLDSMVLVNLRLRIEGAALVRAMDTNSEESYTYFLANFPFALERDRAEELRNEVAYLDALKENTYQGYMAFIKKYPTAERVPEAQKKYDKLLFTTLTADKKIVGYEHFIQEYPKSPYLQDAMDQVFEISTASGTAQSFLKFIERYPQSRKIKVARDILFHLSLDDHQMSTILNDSLQSIGVLSESYLVPFLRDDHFGLMNSEGVDIIKDIGVELPKDYLCGDITEDVVVTKLGILARDGSQLYAGPVEEIDDIGMGFLLVSNDSCTTLLHKSGRRITESCIQDAKVVSNQLLAIEQDDVWSVWTFAGRRLTEETFQEVKSIGDVVALRKHNDWQLTTVDSLANLANGGTLSTTGPYDEVDQWQNMSTIWAKKNGQESILKENFSVLISTADQQLERTFFGTLSKSLKGHTIYNQDFVEMGVFEDSKLFEPWIGVLNKNHWQLFNLEGRNFIGQVYDSINFIGSAAIGFKRDSMEVHFNNHTQHSFTKNSIKFIAGKDSISFLLIAVGDEQVLYSSRGEKLFTVLFDQIQYLGIGVFAITKKQKKGLISLDGKIILSLEYDGIGSVNQQQMVPILKSMKFGMFHISTKKLIKATYEKNLVPYGGQFLVAFKDGAYGFIDWENKPQSKFEFNEVRYWNDSVAWVKKNFEWMLYEIETKTVKLAHVKDYRLIKNTQEEQVAIIHEETAYGVISNTKGVIIPATFSDIVNIGSAAKPFYLTEKFVEEASLFVVIYYNDDGKFLRRQAYEAEDYERIYCPK